MGPTDRRIGIDETEIAPEIAPEFALRAP